MIHVICIECCEVVIVVYDYVLVEDCWTYTRGWNQDTSHCVCVWIYILASLSLIVISCLRLHIFSIALCLFMHISILYYHIISVWDCNCLLSHCVRLIQVSYSYCCSTSCWDCIYLAKLVISLHIVYHIILLGYILFIIVDCFS